LYAGKAYDIVYVKNLKRALTKFLSAEHRLIIFTDRLDQRSELSELGIVRELPRLNFKKLWWYKCWMFSEAAGLSGQCLYFDLDIIFIKHLDKFIAKPGEFKIIHDFNRSNTNNYNYSNSSIMSWTQEQQHQIWTKFQAEARAVQESMHGDQDFIHLHAVNRAWYQDEYAISFKWEYKLNKLYTPDTSAIVFHGKPKPADITDNFLAGFWCAD
jgi:hypothetical protein